MQPQGEALTAGSIIAGRYQISGLLGQGGMSRVYLATDLRLNVRVALKENWQTEAQAREQFRNEAQILARLSHPSLPRVMDHFDDSVTGKQYLVMDYVEGEDLNMMVKRVGRLPETTAVNWIQQILSALEYLHGQQPPVIHRDIKPSNIKITPAGKAVLVDFGIAKMYEESGMTVLGARAATPGYAPPEQYGLRTDQRSDVYALGATLYTLLTGQVPPESTLRVSNLAMVVPPRQIIPDISPQVEMAMLSAMEVDTQRRWQSATEFRSALSASASPPSPAPAAPDFGATSRVPVGPVTPVPGGNRPPVGPPAFPPSADAISRTPLPRSFAAYGAAPPTQAARPDYLPPQASPRKKGSGLVLWGVVGILGLLVIAVGAFLILPALTPKRTVIVIPAASIAPTTRPPETIVVISNIPSPTLQLVALEVTKTPQPPTETAAPTPLPDPTDTPMPSAVAAISATSTLAPPSPAPPTSTKTPAPPTAIPPSATPKGPATVAVVSIRIDPADTRRNQQVTFYVKFRNTFSVPQTRSWSVWVYQDGQTSKGAFWRMEPASTVTLPPGDSELASRTDTVVHGKGGPLAMIVYVKYIAPDGADSPVPDLNGNNSALSFTVNP